MRILLSASAALLLVSTTSRAQEVRGRFGFEAGYLISGDSAVKGRKVVQNGMLRELKLDSDEPTANPTGGLTLMPTVSIAVSSWWPWMDFAYTQSPMVVAPFEDERRGFVDANDIGVALHPANRAWSVQVEGTIAPTYALYCNVKWCLREWVAVGGGVLKVIGQLLQSKKDGTGLHADFTARVFYVQPTAWTWPDLPKEDRDILPYSWLFNGGFTWTL